MSSPDLDHDDFFSPRIRCVVPHCRRTAKRKEEYMGYEVRIICARHWSLVDRRRRRLYAKLRKLSKRIGWTDQMTKLWRANWRRMEKQAIERAVGI